MKKVALVCNMNNNFFTIGRYLRDRGVDAHVFLLGEHEHFQPDADTYTHNFEHFVHEANWIKAGFFSVDPLAIKKIQQDMAGFDLIIACGFAPFFLHRAGVELDIFVPYGSDFYEVPFYFYGNRVFSLLNKLDVLYRNLSGKDFVMKTLRKLGLAKMAGDYRSFKLSYHQAAAIKEAKHIFCICQNDHWEYLVDRIGTHKLMRPVTLPVVYLPEYTRSHIEKHTDSLVSYQLLKAVRGQNDLVIFHHSRHAWKNSPNDLTQKRNDILIRGFADFVHANPATKACLVTAAYGPDVQTSKDLIEELGISNHVLWLPVMQRKEIMACLTLADIGAVDFGLSWVTGGVLFEFMAMQLPIMQLRHDEMYEQLYDELYPIMQSNSETEIKESLEDYLNRPDYYKDMGRQSHEWFVRHVINEPLENYMRIIEA